MVSPSQNTICRPAEPLLITNDLQGAASGVNDYPSVSPWWELWRLPQKVVSPNQLWGLLVARPTIPGHVALGGSALDVTGLCGDRCLPKGYPGAPEEEQKAYYVWESVCD